LGVGVFPRVKKNEGGLMNSIAKKTLVVAVFLIVFGLAVSLPAAAQNPRGNAMGPTTAKGYDHPGQYLHLQDVKPADNMYAVILHPEEEGQHHRDHTLDLGTQASLWAPRL
jgi:hypothetical protein